ncbi:MAG: hypothetical protein RIB60_03105 [Phycisphaerales bacterium]
MTGVRPANETTARLTRETDAHGAWATLAPVLTHAHDHPDDPDAAVLALRVLVQVGLGTLARAAADRCPAGAASRPDVAALIRRARELPALEFAPAERIELGRRNIERFLTRRGIDLRAAYDAWADAERSVRVLATPDGNVIRVPSENPDPRAWRWLSEQRAAARAFAAAHFAHASSDEIAPVAVEGFSPPWIFVEVAGATPRLASGYQPRLRVIQRDPAEFFEGASLIDLASFIDDDRIEWHIGAGAAAGFERAVRAARGAQAIGPGVPIATLRTPIEPAIGDLINTLSAEIVGETSAAAARVRARYAGRDAAWWSDRYQRALVPGSPEPLRVLIPTTRYSTYLQHAARDLAGAFESRGMRAEILIEPDDTTRLSPLAFHDAFEGLEPDLVVLINYTRSSRGDAFPGDVPFVCWIQDEMPHLFTAEAGRSQGPLDFVVGHAVTSLFHTHGYDPDRALYSPVVVSERKFHDGPITPAQRERFACDIAFVSNHSETPEELHRRKLQEAGDEGVRAALELIRPEVERIAEDLMGLRASAAVRAACGRVLQSLGGSRADAESFAMQYGRPMLERIVRHRTLELAADVCDRRGWTLRVFGRGWERHARFGAHAGGEIEHGDDLRACYQASSVQLHASALCMVHQRVMECALSGGLPVGVRSLASLPSLADVLTRAGIAPDDGRSLPDGLSVAFETDAHPALRAWADLLERMGARLPLRPELTIRRAHLERARSHPRARGSFEFDAPWLLGDPAALTFSGEHELERLIDRARTDASWRSERCREIARRVRERATTGGLIDGTLGMIADALGPAALRRSA